MVVLGTVILSMVVLENIEAKKNFALKISKSQITSRFGS
jgi:hypothetical protein